MAETTDLIIPTLDETGRIPAAYLPPQVQEAATAAEVVLPARDAAVAASTTAVDAADRAEAVGDTNDTIMAGVVNTATSATRASLSKAFTRGVSLSATAGTLADLQDGVDLAAADDVPLYLSGTFSVAGSVTLPSKLRVIGMGGVTITQTADLTPHFVGDALDDVTIENVVFVGKGTDYVNNDTVYGATAIKFTGANKRIVIDGCRVDSIAGAGVFVATSATKSVTIRNTVITGVGATTTAQYSAGIIAQDGIQDVTVEGCDISGIAQGIAIGHGSTRILVTGNRVHDTSEHGAYFATSDNYIITNNYFYNTGLLGFKIQQGKPGYLCKSAVITGNHLASNGSNAISITNAIAPGTEFIENVVIDGNVIISCGDTGIRIDSARAVVVVNNIVNGARFAVRVFTSSMVSIGKNMLMNTERTGLLIENTSQVLIDGNTMLNLGIVGPERVGIIVQGTVTGLGLIDNTVDYDTTAQNDAVLFGSGTFTNIRVRGNYLRGANYGIRPSTAIAAMTVWRDNTFIGGVGGYDAVPSFIPSLPNMSGQPLATVEAELNKVKQVLRDQRDARA